MKNNYLVLILMALFLLGLIPLWIFPFDYGFKSVVALCLSGLLIGSGIISIKTLAIPSIEVYKNRFGIDGAIVLVFYMSLSPLLIGHAISFQILLPGAVIGFFLLGYFFKSNYATAISKKSFDKSLLEGEIISDFCSCKENGKTIVGILTLTKNSLRFIPVDFEKPLFDFDLLEQKNIKLLRKFGLPHGFIINENIHISVSYPLLWIHEISAA